MNDLCVVVGVKEMLAHRRRRESYSGRYAYSAQRSRSWTKHMTSDALPCAVAECELEIHSVELTTSFAQRVG